MSCCWIKRKWPLQLWAWRHALTCMCCSSAWPLLCDILTACRSRHYCKPRATPRSERSPAENWSLSKKKKTWGISQFPRETGALRGTGEGVYVVWTPPPDGETRDDGVKQGHTGKNHINQLSLSVYWSPRGSWRTETTTSKTLPSLCYLADPDPDQAACEGDIPSAPKCQRSRVTSDQYLL